MIGVLATGLLAASLSGSPAVAVAPGLQTRVDFNTPGNGQIVDYLEDLIRGASPNSIIRTAQYRMRDKQITDALADVAEDKDKRVHVQVIVDSGTVDDPNYRDLKARLAKTGDKNSWAKSCRDGHGCHGGNAMHNKFFLFSQTEKTSEVVATGSANFSGDSMGGTGGWNSYYTDVGNPGLFARYTRYFNDLKRVVDGTTGPNPDYYEANPPVVTGNTKSYFYPRLDDKGNDTVVNSLKEVTCFPYSTTIRIGVWSLSRLAVAERLRELAGMGCKVDIIASRMSDVACKELTGKRPDSLRIRGFKDPEKNGIHEKNMMIEGRYLPPGTKVVFTGSHNFNNPSLHENDENVIRIMNDENIYARFVNNFTQVSQAATREINTYADCAGIVPKDAAAAERDVE
jgi:phosphatidylserine/phosphatidylglycerophosphate/cardiolipin synthase-like enzyme